MPHFIDTHAHLDEPIYGNDLDVVVKQALADDIWIITVGSDYASSKRAVEIAQRYPTGVYAAVGLHPKNVSQDNLADDRLLDLDKFSQLVTHPKVVAIGEAGLDYHLLPEENRKNREMINRVKENQKKVLSRFLQLAVECRLPLLLHCREAHADMLAMLERWDRTSRTGDIGGIVHHFSGTWPEAKKYFALDFMVSATGLLTYGAYRIDVFKKVPNDRLVLESDCPHMTPVPWSQRRCEPSYLSTVAVSLAGLRKQTVEELSRTTTANVLKVLTKLKG